MFSSHFYSEKNLSPPNGSRNHDPPGAGWMLQPLSYGGLVVSEVMELGSYVTQACYTARLDNVNGFDSHWEDSDFF